MTVLIEFLIGGTFWVGLHYYWKYTERKEKERKRNDSKLNNSSGSVHGR